MRLTGLVAMAAGVILLAGCGPAISIQPLYTEQDLVYDLPLEGTWTAQDDGGVWQVQRSGDGYDFEGSDQKFDVHMLRVNGIRFLDITAPADSTLTISSHMFGKVWMEGSALRFALLNDDWVEKMVRKGLGPQSMISADQEVILTAPSKELQRFVWLNATDPEAFDGEGGVWSRTQ
jgi:hypothetical protein